MSIFDGKRTRIRFRRLPYLSQKGNADRKAHSKRRGDEVSQEPFQSGGDNEVVAGLFGL